MKVFLVRFIGVALAGLALSCGDSGASLGEDCKVDDDCETGLSCFCAADPVPGTCSKMCTDNASCSSYGSSARCTANLCPNVTVCLPN